MTTKTHDPRVRVVSHGTGNWRTEVQDEPGASWDITGPPYPTKAEALLHVDETAARCFDIPPPHHPLLSVSPDQLASAGSYIAHEWGDYGYRIEEITSPTHAVSVFSVVASDGSRFAIAADRWSNCDVLPDDAEARTAKIRAMHAHATQT